MIEQCPQLLAEIQENNRGPTPNIQLISIEQRPAAALNVVTRSGATKHIAAARPAEVAVQVLLLCEGQQYRTGLP